METKFVLPVKSDDFTIYGEGRTSEHVWRSDNIEALSSTIYFPQSSSVGVVLTINSSPEGASIFFNGKKYYRKTNTTCVRDSGEVEVLIKKEGYKAWTQKYDFFSGYNQIINARLSKEN